MCCDADTRFVMEVDRQKNYAQVAYVAPAQKVDIHGNGFPVWPGSIDRQNRRFLG